VNPSPHWSISTCHVAPWLLFMSLFKKGINLTCRVFFQCFFLIAYLFESFPSGKFVPTFEATLPVEFCKYGGHHNLKSEKWKVASVGEVSINKEPVWLICNSSNSHLLVNLAFSWWSLFYINYMVEFLKYNCLMINWKVKNNIIRSNYQFLEILCYYLLH